jgi:hypothetical protein
MKKIFLYGGVLLSVLSLSSCNEDFDNWSALQKNSQQAATAAYGLTFAGSGVSIDMNDANKPDSVKIMTVTSSDTTVSNVVVKNVTVNGYAIPYVLKGTSAWVSTVQLDSVAKESLKSQKYEKRSLTVAASAAAVLKTGEAVAISGSATQAETPIKTPDVDAKGYFILGDANPNGWTPNKPLFLKETATGSNIFTAAVTTTKDGSNWFKFYGGSSYIGDATGWDNVNAAQYGCAVNGDDAAFNYITWSNVQTPVITGAGTWIVTFNANTWTYTVSKPIMYMAGDANGWKQIDYLGSNDGNNFTGFMYLNNNGFKFCTQTDWNGTNYGKDFSTAGDAANINLPDGDAEGYYKVDVSLSSKTMTLTAITRIGIIGDATADGWNSDQPMTYNKTDRAWEVSGITLKTGEIKFRANSDWAINWGGTTDKLTQGGANIKIADDGTYDIKLYAWADGFAKCEITKK